MSQLPDHLDIHLIRILYLLLCEKNVSRVALKLNQPQPSISASLRKLRELTGDPLLVRGTRGMVPTPHGESLMVPARLILDEAEKLFMRKTPFASASESRTFSLAAPDYINPLFFIELAARMRREAPKSQLALHALGPNSDYKKMLSDGELNLVIGNWDNPPPHFHTSALFDDQLICLMRADCPYARRTEENGMTLDDYLQMPHLAPSQILPGFNGQLDAYLNRHNMRRNVVYESAYFNLLPQIAAQSDLALTAGQRYGAYYQRFFTLKAFKIPIAFPPLKFYLLWHERGHQSPQHRWFREQIITAAADAGLR